MPRRRDKELLEALLKKLDLDFDDVFSQTMDGELRVTIPEQSEVREEPEEAEETEEESEVKAETKDTKTEPEGEVPAEKAEVKESKPKLGAAASMLAGQKSEGSKPDFSSLSKLSHKEWLEQRDALAKEAYSEG